MVSHNAAAVNVALDAVNVSLRRVLPHNIVAPVQQHWTLRLIFCNHPMIVAEKSQEMAVVEILVGIEQWLFAVLLFNLLD